MLNIAKWINFFLVLKTHRSIREYEIKVEIMHDETDRDSVGSINKDNTESITVGEKLLNDSIDKSYSIKQ